MKRVILLLILSITISLPTITLAIDEDKKENGLLLNEDASFDAPTANQDKYDKAKQDLHNNKDLEKVLKYQEELRNKGIWGKNDKTSTNKNSSGNKSSSSGNKVASTADNPMGLNPPYKSEFASLYDRSVQLARSGLGCTARDGYVSCIANCTWYVESRIKQLTGVRIGKYGAWGNGGQWNNKALSLSMQYPGQFKLTKTPKFGHILSIPGNSHIRGVSMAQYGGWGHVMFVERVNPDGSIVISEGNWYPCTAGNIKQYGGVRDYNPYKPSSPCILMGSSTTISAGDARGRQYIEIKEVQDIIEGKAKKKH